MENTASTINKKKSLSLYLGVILIILSGYYFIKSKHPSTTPNAMSGFIPEVSVIVVKKSDTELSLDLPGRVAAHKISEVRPQVDGVLKERIFEEGSIVEKGQQLYQIDPNLYQIAVNGAKDNLKALQAKKTRYENLIKEEAVSKQELDDVTGALAAAEAEFKRAKTNLNYTKVYAPISGYIGKSNITEGALVAANQATILTTITQLSPIYVDMILPSKELSKLENQDELEVTLKINGNDFLEKGVLKFSEKFVDESTDSLRLRAIFKNEDGKLLPGMFANAKVILQKTSAITIPQRVTSRMPDGSLSVFVIDKDNVAKVRIIKEGEIIGDSWVVNDGLNEGDLVVYEGHQKIADGAKVTTKLLEL